MREEVLGLKGGGLGDRVGDLWTAWSVVDSQGRSWEGEGKGWGHWAVTLGWAFLVGLR